MFRVYLPVLRESCNDMQMQSQGCKNQIDEIDGVMSNLRSLSGLEHAIKALASRKEQLETYNSELVQMMMALERVSRAYDSTELSIVANAEGNYRRTSSVSVNVINGIMNDSIDYFKPWKV